MTFKSIQKIFSYTKALLKFKNWRKIIENFLDKDSWSLCRKGIGKDFERRGKAKLPSLIAKCFLYLLTEAKNAVWEATLWGKTPCTWWKILQLLRLVCERRTHQLITFFFFLWILQLFKQNIYKHFFVLFLDITLNVHPKNTHAQPIKMSIFLFQMT